MEMADLNDEWACLSGGDGKLVDQMCVVRDGVGQPSVKIGALVTGFIGSKPEFEAGENGGVRREQPIIPTSFLCSTSEDSSDEGREF